MTENKLPRTDSIQELARFWDSHDLTEFDGELEEVQEPAFERGTVVSVRLSPDEMEAIQGMARARRLNLGDLIHEWVAEKVHK